MVSAVNLKNGEQKKKKKKKDKKKNYIYTHIKFLGRQPTFQGGVERGQASELINKPSPAHHYEFPLGILIRVREARNQPYLGIPDFKVVVVLKAIVATIQEAYVVMGQPKVI